MDVLGFMGGGREDEVLDVDLINRSVFFMPVKSTLVLKEKMAEEV